MSYYIETREITHQGALAVIQAAVKAAEAMNAPQCIVVADPRGRVVASLRMNGAKFTSMHTATAKAVTAASSRAPSGTLPVAVENLMALGTDGQVTNLKGGLPIYVDGHFIGAIGVGSGLPEEDIEVAQAGLQAIGASSE